MVEVLTFNGSDPMGTLFERFYLNMSPFETLEFDEMKKRRW